MKKIALLILMPLALLYYQCSKDTDATKSKNISSNELAIKKQEIITYISGFNCTTTCNFIALGAKPCGGPKEYLAYSSLVNETLLTEMVVAYNLLENDYNIQNELISDCAIISPPNEVNCVNGVCKIIN